MIASLGNASSQPSRLIDLKRCAGIGADTASSISHAQPPFYFQLDPDPILAGSEAERAIDRLKSSILAARPGTHTEWLEAVARACGYRSWHAAQGRDR